MSAVQIPVKVEQFPAQLKQLRNERELTQKELAEKAKISQQTISAIEQGRMEPSLRIVSAIAVVLGIILMVGAWSAAGKETRQETVR